MQKMIISLAKQHTSKILFVGTPPLAEDEVELKGEGYSDKRVKEYEERLQIIVNEAGITFVSVRPAFEHAGLGNLYTSDLIHPNDTGHELISKLVEPELNKLLSII